MGDALKVRWAGDPAPLSKALGRPDGFEVVAAGTMPAGVAVPNAVFPHIRGQGDGSGFSAGPTGEPWIDANGWKIRVARALNPEAPLWLTYEFPKGAVLSPERYQLCVAEARVYGAEWIVAPDDELRQATMAGNERATATWKRIAATHAFFQRHPEWRSYRETARLVLVSDFALPERLLAIETVNMAARYQLSTRLHRPGTVSSDALADAAAVLWMDRKPVPDPVVQFVRRGGILVMNSLAPAVPGTTLAEDTHPRFRVHSLGQGSIIVSRKPWTDPYLIAVDTQLLISKRNEVLKLWNAGSMIATAVASPGGERAIVAILNYTCRTAAHPVSLRLEHKYSAAQWQAIAQSGSTTLPFQPAGQGIEVGLPPFPVFAAVEFQT